MCSAKRLSKGAMMLCNFTFVQRLYRCSAMLLRKGAIMPRNLTIVQRLHRCTAMRLQWYCTILLLYRTIVHRCCAKRLRKGAMMLRNFIFEQRLYGCSAMRLCKGGKMPRNYRLRNWFSNFSKTLWKDDWYFLLQKIASKHNTMQYLFVFKFLHVRKFDIPQGGIRNPDNAVKGLSPFGSESSRTMYKSVP